MAKKYKVYLYQAIYTWALKKWRKESGTYIAKSYGKLSDHALLRYFERVEGIDVSGVRHSLLSEDVQQKTNEVGGNGKFIVNDILYTVRGGIICSIARPNPNQAIISGLNGKSSIARKWSF